MLDKERYGHLEVREQLQEIYPSMYLPPPWEVPSYTMSSCEREFLQLLEERELIVFIKPRIEDIDFIPDYFVYNPNTGRGKLVEITLMSMNGNGSKVNKKTKERKKRQLERLQSCGIPYVALYREHLEKIREYCCDTLF